MNLLSNISIDLKNLMQTTYPTFYEPKYDFIDQSYKDLYPNLHKYPATMLPQIGLELLKDFKAKKTNLLDPYCGSGSSFMSGLKYGIKEFVGFDLNPLAIMISKARLDFIDADFLKNSIDDLLNKISMEKFKKSYNANILSNITNIDFWIDKDAQIYLLYLYDLIMTSCFSKLKKQDSSLKNLVLLAFSETLREVSYTRNNEFKLFRMKNFENYKPEVFKIFTIKLKFICQKYLDFYYPLLKTNIFKYFLYNQAFSSSVLNIKFDTLLTSPPYGDSRTTVAYGQFSVFINEWLGFKKARKLDSMLMGGKKENKLYREGLISPYIAEIDKIDPKRALEISSFYFDLKLSIKSLINSIATGGKVFFVVGNRRVKNIVLPTDKFITETFCNYGFKHIKTIKRKISNKVMPLKNSPTNQTGISSHTMNEEWIIICEKIV